MLIVDTRWYHNSTEVFRDREIAAAILGGLKTSWDGHQFGKVVSVDQVYGRYELGSSMSDT